MMSAVYEATRHFCTDVFGFELKTGARLGENVYGASIPVTKGREEYQFFLYFKQDTLNYFAKSLLGVDILKDANLEDVSREVANQIIGYAKNIWNENGGDFKLGTPEFLGQVESFHINLDDFMLFKMKNRTFEIGYKKI